MPSGSIVFEYEDDGSVSIKCGTCDRKQIFENVSDLVKWVQKTGRKCQICVCKELYAEDVARNPNEYEMIVNETMGPPEQGMSRPDLKDLGDMDIE
jgi:hypothetical protein